MLPNKFRSWFGYRGLNIDSAEFGWILPEESHRIKGGPYGKIHPEWENEWNRFITNNPDATRQQVLRKLDKMKRKRQFVNILAQGSKATMNYDKWLDLAKETREKFIKKYQKIIVKKKTGEIFVKKVAMLGLIFILADINNKGFAAGITNNLLDQVPYLGWTKMADECVHGNWIPDKGETSSLIERYKDADAFSELMM